MEGLSRTIAGGFVEGGIRNPLTLTHIGENEKSLVMPLTTEPSLVSRSIEFQTAMQDGDKSSLRVLCEKKSEEAKSEDDRETWGFLKVMFEDDGTLRTKLLTQLGFSVHEEKVQENLSEAINALGLDNGEDFLNLQSPKADPSLSFFDDSTDQLGSVPSEEQMQQELDGQGDASSLDDSIRHALVVGDYKGAVSQCISANRMADALVIANLGGASLWEFTRDQYLKKSYSSYLKVVSAMVNNDLMSLVNTRPLDSWKETLALLCNFADKEWTVLCDTLASRLMGFGNTLAATLCYICAGNVDKTVEMWSRSLMHEHDGRTYVDLLQDLMEKTIILALATGQKRFSASLSKLVENYAELLISQGLLTTAMEYLQLLGSEESSQMLSILQDRIALSAEENGAPKQSRCEHAQTQNESVYGADQPDFDMNSGSQLYADMEQDLTEAIRKESWDCSICGVKRLGEAEKDEHQLRHNREQRLAEIEEERKTARMREEERVKQDQMRAQASLDKILREEQSKNDYINKKQRNNEILARRPQRKRNSGREEWESVRKLGKGGRR